jgi:hypothetical protein
VSGFRQFIIRTAEIFVVIVVALMTLGFAVQGYAAGMMAGGGGLGFVTFLLGGLFGFVLSSLLAATFFLLAEIAENTRRA